MKTCNTCILLLICVTPITAQLRGLAACPTLDHVLDESGVTDGVSKWLTKVDGTSFIADLFVDYLTDDTHGPLTSVSGQYLLDGNLPVCKKLPLKADQCFIAANPDQSFFRHIVANKVPFGDHIVGAVEYVEDFIDQFQEEIDNFASKFYLQDETGLCILGNDKMIGIYENPGYPNPGIFALCNAISKFKSGTDACAIQPSFKGFALSTSGSNSLVMTDQLPGNFYDGYATYKFSPQGDAFAAFNLNMKFPTSETAKIGPDLRSTILSFLAQPPDPDIEIGGSLFVKNPTSADSELLYLLTIDAMKLNLKLGRQKFLSVNFGNAFAAMRSNTANPSCQPSGIFLSANIEESSLGPLLEGFFDQFIPSAEVDAGIILSDGASGVTSLDPLKTLGDIEAVFYRLKMDQVGFMGITIDKPSFEVQYFTGKEMRRRRSWTAATCCSNDNVLNDDNSCGVVQSPLTDFINSGAPEQTTLAMFFAIEQISFFGVVKFKNIAVELYSQIPDENSGVVSTTLDMKCSVDVLFIAGVDAKAKFKMVTDPDTLNTNMYASFHVKASVDAKLFKMTATISGSADVTQFSYKSASNRRLAAEVNQTSSERRLTLGGGSLTDADWDLDVDVKIESAVLDAVLDFVEDLVEEVYQHVEKAWNEVEDFAGEQWDAVKGLADDIGTPASDIVGALDGAVGGAVDLAGDGLEALSDLLSGTPLDDHLAPVVGAAVGFVGDILKNQAKAYVALGKGLFAGDIAAIGNFALAPLKMAGLFGTSIRHKHMIDVPGQTDGEFGCTKKRWRFKKCKKYVVKTVCKWRHSDPFDNEDCVREGMQKKSRKLDNLRRLSTAARNKVKCQKDNKNDNAGVKWFHDRKSAGGRVIDASMSDIRQHVGKISKMGDTKCRKLGLTVGAKALQKEGGLESGRRSQQVETDDCVDLRNQDSLNAALGQLQTKSGEKIKELVLSESTGPNRCLTGGLTYTAAPKGKCKTPMGQTKVRMPKIDCETFGGSTIDSSDGPWTECLIDLCEEEAGALEGEAIFAAGIDQCQKFVAHGSVDLHHELCEQIGGISSPSEGGIYAECHVHWCKASQGTKNHKHFTFGGYGGTCKDRVGAAILEMTKGDCDRIGGYYPFAYNEASQSTWLACEAELCSNHHVNIQHSEDNPVKLIASEKGGCNTLLGRGKLQTTSVDCRVMFGISPSQKKSVNVALSKPVRQTAHSPYSHMSQTLTNGNTNDLAHTQLEDNPWFEIDLGDDFIVDHITVHNRKDCCQGRSNNLKVELFDEHRNALALYGPSDMSNVPSVDFDLFSGGHGLLRNNTMCFPTRYVKVSVPTRNYLNLAEVEVFGVLEEDTPCKSKTWTQCELDWCDAAAGTKTGRGYGVGSLGSCDEKAGYAIIHIPKHHCDEIKGGVNAHQLQGEFELVECHVDWCVIDENKGTADGVGMLPSSVGGCADHFSHGGIDMDESLCRTVGGIYELYPDNPSRKGCFLDWCRHTDIASMLPGVSEGADLTDLFFPGQFGQCRYKAFYTVLPVHGDVCRALDGKTNKGWILPGFEYDCHFDFCRAGGEDGPSVLLDEEATSLVISAPENCNTLVNRGIIKMYQNDCEAFGGTFHSPGVEAKHWCDVHYCDAKTGTKDGRGLLFAKPGACKALGKIKVATVHVHMPRGDCQAAGGTLIGQSTWVDCYFDFCEVEAPNADQFVDEEL